MSTHITPRILLALTTIISLVSVSSSVSAEEPAMPTAPAESEQFAKIKSLVGTWEGTGGKENATDEERKPITVTYKLTAGGSTVMETVFADTPMEMITMYHMDGQDLVLTHYCMTANQPTMTAQPSDDPNIIPFKFTGGANIATGNEMHMHHAVHTLTDNDNIQSRWTLYINGEPDHTALLELHRIPTDG
jgi:hypothetical protein